MRLSSLLTLFVTFAIVAGLALMVRDRLQRHPQDLPWTDLNLADPLGQFTGRKLTALTGETRQCLALLDRAAVRYTALPPRTEGQCGYADAVRLRTNDTLPVRWRPGDLGVSCPVAAALLLWNREIVQPAAWRHFGSRVAQIDTFGSYNCRRLYGRASGDWSEHATADAVDVAGFRLEDGRRVSVKSHWSDDAARSAFLREVRDGACRLFATVLSPDYNAAHADHLHLDQAERGAMGWRACR